MATLNKGIELINAAIEKDRNHDYKEALDLYIGGVEQFFSFARSDQCTEQVKALLAKKTATYLERAGTIQEQLKQVLTKTDSVAQPEIDSQAQSHSLTTITKSSMRNTETQTESSFSHELDPIESGMALRAYAVCSALQRTFECIVCTCIAEPRILQCCRNVAPCNTCLFKLQQCPLCRKQLASAIEQRVTKLNGFDTVYSLLKDSDESGPQSNT